MNKQDRTPGGRLTLTLVSVVTVLPTGCVLLDKDDFETHLSDHYGVRAVFTANDQSFAVTTFNVGLAPHVVAHTKERLRPIKQALRKHDADVLCLQEVWRSADAAAIRDAISERYPHQYTAPAIQKESGTSPVCSSVAFDPLVTCVREQCLETLPRFECSTSACVAEWSDVVASEEGECVQALLALYGHGDLKSFLARAPDLLRNQPADLFAFDGASGLLVASKSPLSDLTVLDFDQVAATTLTHRVALVADVTGSGVFGQGATVACTHISSDTPFPYPGTADSWEDEALRQVQALTAALQTRRADGPLLVAGDLNCSVGNSTTGAGSEAEAVCGVLSAAGFDDPAAATIDCTLCDDNLVVQKRDFGGGTDVMLDHVMVLGLDEVVTVTADRVFDETVSVERD
jgi:endonuclease/exonuclease/phosphatase family metal-dependent hydrolase